MFYDNFVKLCNSVNKSPSAVALEIGIYKSTVSNWKNRGTYPTDATMQKIADYFDVSVEELKKEKPSTESGEGLSKDRIKELLNQMSAADLAELMADCAEVMRKRSAEP